MYRESKSELRKELEQLREDADKATKEYAVITGRSEESLREEAEEAFRIFKEINIDPILEKEGSYAKA